MFLKPIENTNFNIGNLYIKSSKNYPSKSAFCLSLEAQ